ncbi:SDR family oxidoreductase [bacterium NHP-B]|nr:SDR family oxidoreductase [bacterium NHP-B]
MAFRFLVTGALGHIGSSLIRYLPECFPSSEIVMLDDLSTQRYASLFHLPQKGCYRFIEARVQDASLKDIIKNVDVVFHLAALTDAAGTAGEPDRVWHNNMGATKALINACLAWDKVMIFPSSTSVYGSQSQKVDETCNDLVPQSPYAQCKIEEEGMMHKAFAQGLKGTICRLGTIYGFSPGMRFHTAVNKFCWQAVMGQEITVWKTAFDQRRPYLDVQDAVKGLCHIVQHTLFDGMIYNLVTHNHTVRDVVETIRQHVPSLKVAFVTNRIMNQLSYDVSHARFQETGFTFSGNLNQGIQDTIHALINANRFIA